MRKATNDNNNKYPKTCTGKGLMEEAEFLQWITRIQVIRDEHDAPSTSSSKNSNATDENDEATQDLIAAFR